ncbi:hypothetical protein N8J89_23205 [Crossiella sp. CA-258035]|uniref:hypothetical protein n=1 Tax=Crossiella sp. CA-258035 TaxID=2981138 RepID=UPI0024BC50C6|nr:hypothetical protein [Crossiella sp. CA-258035]WHT16039.1 hypothetical protein N8J89_23205 [Crossiella sp. CA-258035]
MSGMDDVSDWEPAEANWYKVGSSIIFAVLHGSEGWLDCEVWRGEPTSPLPLQMFDEELLLDTGWLAVHDPNENVQMKLRCRAGRIRIKALVDDLDFASKVQLCMAFPTD